MRKGNSGGKEEEEEEKTDENRGHYVIASSRPPERRPLEHRTLVPINFYFEIFFIRKGLLTVALSCLKQEILYQGN